MERTKDLYNILEVNKSCSSDDIKKSYKKLVLKYHPDKCDLPDAQSKFIDIQNAYRVLSNSLERKKYDELNTLQRVEFYDSLKKYIQLKIPNIDEYIKLFFDDEIKLKDHIERMDIMGIYNKIMEKIPNINLQELTFPKLEDINIYGNISTTFEERYQDKYRKIQVNRLTKNPNMFCIPLRESKVIIPGEGEFDRINNKHGDIIINIELINKNDIDYMQIKNDILYIKYISLYEYLYGGELTLEHLHGHKETLHIKFDSFVEKFPLITIEGKGMPVSEHSKFILCDQVHKNIERGNLLISIKIKDLERLNKNIFKLCDESFNNELK